VQAILTKPVVGLQRNRHRIATLPSGAVIELHNHADRVGLVDVEWNGQRFSVFREDLLDACTVDDVVRVSFF
jgi:hypothetical protein